MRITATVLGLSLVMGVGGAAAMTTVPLTALSDAAREVEHGPPTPVGYFCSPGFEATSGERCVATASTDQVDLYLNEPPAYAEPPPVRRHRVRRKGVRERY